MANFSTHLGVATTCSGAVSSWLLANQAIDLPQGLMLWVCGTAGGLLPDIDSDASSPLKILFTVLGTLGVLAFLSSFNGRLPLIPLWAGALLSYFIIRFILLGIFARFTVHRGVFHSLLAAVFWGLVTVFLSLYITKQGAIFAWLAGLFVVGGFIIHLLLDELYAVNLENMELKRSFGSAMKLFSLNNWLGSLGLMLVTTALWFFLPSIQVLARLPISWPTWHQFWF